MHSYIAGLCNVYYTVQNCIVSSLRTREHQGSHPEPPTLFFEPLFFRVVNWDPAGSAAGGRKTRDLASHP